MKSTFLKSFMVDNDREKLLLRKKCKNK